MRETQQRIALAVAEHERASRCPPSCAPLAMRVGLDEIALAREFDSGRGGYLVLMRYVKSIVETDGSPPRHLLEEYQAGRLEDEEILEAISMWRSPPSGIS